MKRKLTKNELFDMLSEYGIVEKWCAEFHGESWTKSGTSYGWSGGGIAIESDKPLKFVEFHKFLHDKFPHLTYMEYLEIEDNCVWTDIAYENDYYTERNVEYWVADIDKLVKYLPLYWDADYEMTCEYCNKNFKFDKSDIEDMDGGIGGDWNGVKCPHCGKYNQTYSSNRINLHE